MTMHADFNQLKYFDFQHLKHIHKHNSRCDYDSQSYIL